ncbi:hypothetical protein G6F56_000116 [Rhizopus delemar]|nr:hypothetical protein G6F56_000116 [Rhizopus delemar]
MIFNVISKCLLVLSYIAVINATNIESETEQPTKLLGGIISKPESCGFKASSTSIVKIHYRSRIWGKEEHFENTYLRQIPLEYKLGSGKLLKGIENGVHGMCTGEIRRLVIPADQAYGELGIPNLVPSNTAIVVDVEMLNNEHGIVEVLGFG